MRSIGILTVKAALLCLVLWYVGRALYAGFSHVEWQNVDFRAEWILASMAITLGSTTVGSWVLRLIYSRLGYELTVPQAFRLYTVPQLGKYIPGKVMAVAGHVALARTWGVPLSVSTSSVGLMMGLGETGAVLLGFLLLIFQPLPGLPDGVLRLVLAAAFAAAMLALLHPGVYFRLMNWALGMTGRPPIRAKVSVGLMGGMILALMVQTALYGAGFFLAMESVVRVNASLLAYMIGTFCLANVLGFLALFAPAGIGVREGVFVFLLAPVLPAGDVALIAVAARLWQTAMDLLMAGIGTWWGRSSRPRACETTTP